MNLFQLTDKKQKEAEKIVQEFINKGGVVQMIPTSKEIKPGARTWKK